MDRKRAIFRTTVLSCLFEGIIILGVFVGLLGDSTVRAIGIAIAFMGLLSLAYLTYSVTRKW